MKKTVTASALMLTMVLSTALLGACSKTEKTTTTPAGTTSTTTTTPVAPAATGTTDSTTTGAAATAPAADAAAAAANNAAAAANSAASAATSAANAASQKAGDALGDSAVTGKVKAMLLADSEVKGTDITVETNKGEVMLSGFVQSQAQIDKAVKLAGTVEGVQKVSNKLEVKK